PLENLDDAPDLVVAPDHRVELALPRALGHVQRVFLERFARPFGFRAADAFTAAYCEDGLFERRTRSPMLFQKATRFTLVAGQREQEHLRGDELVTSFLGLLVGEIEQIAQISRDGDFAALAFDLGQAPEGGVERALEARDVDPRAPQERRAAAILLL